MDPEFVVRFARLNFPSPQISKTHVQFEFRIITHSLASLNSCLWCKCAANYQINKRYSLISYESLLLLLSSSDMTFFSRLLLLVRVSRVAGWCIGPMLYTIGILHSKDIPKDPTAILGYCIQIASLSFPLCIGEQHIHFIPFAN